MKKKLFFVFAWLVSTSVFAATEHYFRRDGNHVQHLKITQRGEEITVAMDVDFEPMGSGEAGARPCSASISGEAKAAGENALVLRKQLEGEARYCVLTIQLTGDEAKVEQSKDCDYFAAGICHFQSEGKPLMKVK